MPTSVLIVVISSVVMVVKLGRARKMRKEMSTSQSERSTGEAEAKITQMLLSVCCLFIIFTVPETTGTLVNVFLPQFDLRGCYRNTFQLFFQVVSVASCLNASVNSIAYISLSAKFRTTLRQVLRCWAGPTTVADNLNPGKPRTSASRLSAV